MFSYPLSLRFKIIALDSTIYLTDSTGREILFVKKGFLRLREKIKIFTDSSQTNHRFTISTSQIIDLGATYEVTDEEKKMVVFRIKHYGWSFLWRSRYTVLDLHNQPIAQIKEDNPWIEILNGFLGEIPYLQILTIWLFNPTYTLTDTAGIPLLTLKKKPSLFERMFVIEKGQASSLLDEDSAVLTALMTVIFQRSRG